MKRVLENPPRSPRARLAARFLRERGHLIALALIFAVGVATLDDYAVIPDAPPQWDIVGRGNFEYILGDEDAIIDNVIRFYGAAFEIPIIVFQRVVGLEDSRDIFLSRFLITHAFFIVGGFFAWLLTYRLFGSRAIALIVTLLFLLHPRIYAHSFINTKDIPFLSMFMITLYLIHRAFRRETVWAFALCGAGAGLLMSVRVLGIMLFAAVLGMLALDGLRALTRGGGAKRVLVNGAAFSLAASLALYATFPIMWKNPLALLESFPALARHPAIIHTLFRGEWVGWPNMPWSFIPVWTLITTPPAALALAALGSAYVVRLCAANPRGALANSAARFGLLALACPVLTVSSAIILNINMYDDWRQMYFLYAPLCVLAAFGLRGLISLLAKREYRIAVYAAAGAALIIVAAQMVRLHPYNSDYFNIFVSRGAPESLAGRYMMDYMGVSRLEALRHLLDAYPDRRVSVYAVERLERSGYLLHNRRIIPKEDRERLILSHAFPDFAVSGGSADDPVWSREIYGVPIVSVADVRAESKAAHRAAYEAARAAQPLAESVFDIYAGGGGLGGDALVYVKEPCAEEDTRGRFFIRAFPFRQDKLGEEARAGGLDYNTLRFDFAARGALYGGVCVMEYSLPPYPVRAFEVGQTLADGEPPLWSAAFSNGKYRQAYADALSAEPAAESVFNIYVDGRTLTYVKEPCSEEDARGRFQLWAFPEREGDLSIASERTGLEYNSLNFDFSDYGVIFDGKCVASRTLPAYAATHVETGQWLPGEGGLWSARINFEAGVEWYMRTAAELSVQPSIQSNYNVYLQDDVLAYVKDPCEAEDTKARFFLSAMPVNESDLSDDSRERGFAHNAMNFDFARYGVLNEGKCVIIRTLPDYPIRRLETGQWLAGAGHLWNGAIDISE